MFLYPKTAVKITSVRRPHNRILKSETNKMRPYSRQNCQFTFLKPNNVFSVHTNNKIQIEMWVKTMWLCMHNYNIVLGLFIHGGCESDTSCSSYNKSVRCISRTTRPCDISLKKTVLIDRSPLGSCNTVSSEGT